MNLLAALLVVVRYTLHNVKTFILVIYCVVLRIYFCQLHYCLAEVVDVSIWLIFFKNLIGFHHFFAVFVV